MERKQASAYKPYVIQCSGLIGLPERQQLEALEVLLCEYYPGSAFLARVREEKLAAVKKLPFVTAVSLFGAAQKFAGGLMKALVLTPDGLGKKKQVIVKLFENAGAGAVVDFVRNKGGRVAGHDSQWLEIELLPEQLAQLAQLHEVHCIEEKGEYELLNNRAGEIIRTPSLWNKGLSGAGQIIGIADTGLDTGVLETLHTDLKSKVAAIYALGRKGDASDPNGHGTHIAGTAYGKGSASQGRYRGMAPAASLVFQSIMDKEGKLSGVPSDLGILLRQAYEAGARLYNISWGMSANSAYNYAAAQVDRFVWEHDDMAVAIAAGNNGEARSITSPATAKNVITVGASENNRPEKGIVSDNPAELAFFSSRGPTSDGRRKPDVVAPGTWILSTRSSLPQADNFWGVEDQHYAYNSGTSMAAPIVTGMLALVREYFIQTRSCQPCAALLKAALLDGAFVLPGYMENDEGWGRLKAPDPAINPARECLFVNQETKLATGESKTYEYLLSAAGGPLKITLVWTDYPAQVNAAALVNDLDLTVQSPSGQTFCPGDHINNVEQVVIPDPPAGVYKVTVSGYHVPMGYQHYALFVNSSDASGSSPSS
ncbi:MAG: S8 family serine peptidase [Desulfotomaculaceae bacterium]|nr:S8 family serine peptidase [Desulfotomaculaceae bacterium]